MRRAACSWTGLLVRDVHLRDLAWALLTPTNADDHVRLWGAVVARVPPTLARCASVPAGHGRVGGWGWRIAELLLRTIDPRRPRTIRWAECSPRSAAGHSAKALWEEIGRDIQDELRAGVRVAVRIAVAASGSTAHLGAQPLGCLHDVASWCAARR